MHDESVSFREPVAIVFPSKVFPDSLATVYSHQPKLFRIIIKIQNCLGKGVRIELDIEAVREAEQAPQRA